MAVRRVDRIEHQRHVKLAVAHQSYRLRGRAFRDDLLDIGMFSTETCAQISEEAATCKRRASGAQRTKMSEYREWFAERRRPPRG